MVGLTPKAKARANLLVVVSQTRRFVAMSEKGMEGFGLLAQKLQRVLRFAIAMPIADPRNRSEFRVKRKQCCIAI